MSQRKTKVTCLKDAKEKKKAVRSFIDNGSIFSRQAVVYEGTTVPEVEYADENSISLRNDSV